MGHSLVGTLPDTAPWRRVVQLLAEEEEVSAVAAATTEAAVAGLDRARHDDGLAFCVWLLAQVVQAARQDDFASGLRAAGLDTPADPGVYDLAAAFVEAVDRRLQANHCRSDIGEMAEMAAVETLHGLLGQRAANAFGTTPEQVKGAARDLSTKKGFGTLAHDFFSRFTQRFLAFHLGRELSLHVGPNGRFESSSDHLDFVEDLRVHSRQAAGIMKRYAADWYSKRLAPGGGGLTLEWTRRFVRRCVGKVQKELLIRGGRHGK